MKALFALILMALASLQGIAQSSFHVDFSWELSGDLVNIQKGLGIQLHKNISPRWSLDGYFRASIGQSFSVFNSTDDRPGNYVLFGEEFVFAGDTEVDPIDPGVRRLDGESNFTLISNGYRISYSAPITRSIKARFGAGFGLTYLDWNYIVLQGTLDFVAEGIRTPIWGVVPAFNRGLGVFWTASVGVEADYKNMLFGLSLAPEIGAVYPMAGNRYPIILSVGVPLTRRASDQEETNIHDQRKLSLEATLGWTYLGHSKLGGLNFRTGVWYLISDDWSIGLFGGVSYAIGERIVDIQKGHSYNIADFHNPSLWGLETTFDPDRSSFLATFPAATDKSVQFDISPMVRWGQELGQKRWSLGIGGVLALIQKTYLVDVREGDLEFLNQPFADDVLLVSPFYAHYLDLGGRLEVSVELFSGASSSYGPFVDMMYLSQGQMNFCAGMSARF